MRESMSDKDVETADDRGRAAWERPTLRRLATEYAEGGGPTQNEGNCTIAFPNSHSRKNAICP
jgi:hypothetical protein